jgi:hypothetical protein
MLLVKDRKLLLQTSHVQNYDVQKILCIALSLFRYLV